MRNIDIVVKKSGRKSEKAKGRTTESGRVSGRERARTKVNIYCP